MKWLSLAYKVPSKYRTSSVWHLANGYAFMILGKVHDVKKVPVALREKRDGLAALGESKSARNDTATWNARNRQNDRLVAHGVKISETNIRKGAVSDVLDFGNPASLAPFS